MKPTIIAIIIGGAFVVAAFILSQGNSTTPASASPANNVTIENGKQIVSITAKGGYSPKISKAKADMPTTLRMTTNGTFDCSSALALPSIGYEKNLPPSGTTDVDIPPQKAGTTFQGLCAMGMQRFEVAFE